MNWFFIALIGPILYSVSNHTDKYIVSKIVKEGEVGAIIIFSSLFSIVALPIAFFFSPDVFNVTLLQGIVLAVNSMLIVFSLLLYFYALNEDEASYVIPFYQTIPVFGYIIGYFVLGETISPIQMLASLAIIFGALILSFDIGQEKIHFKKTVVATMLGASLCYAVNGVVYKLFALDTGYWPSMFWGFVGKIVLGVLFFFFVSSYRRQFVEMVKDNNFVALGLISFSEALFLIGEAATSYAFLIAPVVLVMLVNAFQPFFVFVLGVLITIFFPKISQESLDRKMIMQKVIGIGFIIIGTYFTGI